MSSTARTKDEEKEFFDGPESLDRKVTLLAKYIKESKHSIAFTGAGISTSCGIPDFRSGVDTVLDTGAGKWAAQAATKRGVKVKAGSRKTSTLKAIPSATHMTLVALAKHGLLNFLISQNCDGLHRRSGFPHTQLSELHGNTNLEICKKCGKQYMRDFRCRNNKSCHNHKTGRKCEVETCRGPLCDTIINFGENLPAKPLSDAEKNTDKADLCLAMGSSLTVTPAADFPEQVGNSENGHLVIVNLQKTPLDSYASEKNGGIRIYAKTDDVSKLLMTKLGLDIPQWRLVRYIRLTVEMVDTKSRDVSVSALEADGTPAAIFSSIQFSHGDNVKHNKAMSATNMLRQSNFRTKQWLADGSATDEAETEEKKSDDLIPFQLELEFGGHYKEPTLKIDLRNYLVSEDAGALALKLSYDPFKREWEVPLPKELESDAIVTALNKLKL